MIDNSTFLWILGGCLTVIGYFLKGALERVAVLEDKYNTLHEYYVKRDDFLDFKDELFKRLDRLEAKLK